MKTSFLISCLLLGALLNKNIAQTKSNSEISKLTTYDVLLYDDTRFNKPNNENTSAKKDELQSNTKNHFLTPTEQKILLDYLSGIHNFTDVIILNSKNKRVEKKIDFENCYLSYDTVKIENNKTGITSIKVFQNNFLDTSNLLKVKFYEKWTINEVTMSMNKEILGYSILMNKLMNGTELVEQLLFTIISNNTSLTYLNSNEYLK